MGYTHIEENERRRIERAHKAGKGVREIARMVGRSPSTICEEIKHNSVNGTYAREKAERKSRQRRKLSKLQCLKVAMDPDLKKYVLEKMRAEWSPEIIAGRLKNIDTHLMYASTKAIYKFVSSPHGRVVEKFLYSKVHKKRGGPKRGTRRVKLDGRTMIDKRPTHIDSRNEFGHYEGDFMESGRDGTGSLLHLVERKTRYPFLSPVSDKRTGAVNTLAAKMLKDAEPESLTIDNDLSFAKHAAMSDLIGAPIYFCNPYHSWEKGTVENRNRAVRFFLPKGTNLSTVEETHLKEIETKLRNRPLKVLWFQTPQEAWDIEMEKRAQRKKRAEKNQRGTVKSLLTFTKVAKVGVRLEGFL